MRISIIRTIEEFDSLEPEWNQLLSNSAVDSVFLTHEWISSWLAVARNPVPIFIISVRDEHNSLLTLAPFYQASYRLLGLVPVTVLRVLGDQHSGSEYGNIIIRRGNSQIATDHLRKALTDCRREWDMIFVQDVASWTPEATEGLEMMATGSLRARIRPRSFSSVLLPSDFDGFLSMMSRNARSQIRRQRRNIEANHKISIEQVTSREALEPAMATLFELHAKRWNTKNQAGSFNRSPALKRFYEQFLPRALEQGWLGMYTLYLDDEPAAIQYGVIYRNVFCQIQEGFDPNKHSGAGNYLRAKVVDDAITASIMEYDFLGGFTEHKRRWAAVERFGSDYLICHGSGLSSLLGALPIWPSGRYLSISA